MTHQTFIKKFKQKKVLLDFQLKYDINRNK